MAYYFLKAFLANSVSTLWRLVSCLDAVMCFFFTMESILRSCTTADLHHGLGLFMFTGASFFSECSKMLIWPLLMFPHSL